MGKYALENYEPIPIVKFRPQPMAGEGIGDGRFSCFAASWKELEPSRGSYRLEKLQAGIGQSANPVLELVPDVPEWVEEDASAHYAALIRKVGSLAGSDNRLRGVILAMLEDRAEERNAYAEAFDGVPLIADLRQASLIRHFKERQRGFGLRIACGEDDWIACCEEIARQSLSDTWKNYPVFLHVTDEVCGPNVRREARRWHAAFSNVEAGLGRRLELRKMTFPRDAVAGGSLPVRLWLVLSGTANLYRDFELRIRLAGQGERYVVPLSARTREWRVGDIVHNEIASLPPMPPGVYGVGIGLFDDGGAPVGMNIGGEASEGYYDAGEMNVVHADSDPLARLWDDYYPEGYYPLEDPKAPQQ